MRKLFAMLLILGGLLTLFSYGFVDPNFPHFHASPFARVVTELVYRTPRIAAVIYAVLLLAIFCCYQLLLRFDIENAGTQVRRYVTALIVILLFSYPALSYDIFNYMATAKIAFHYRENPYVVMPIEFVHEPMLAYTRAANKLALYGPVWIVATGIPSLVGFRQILATLFAFKFFVAICYAALVYLIFRKTKSVQQTLWFALNPLVIIETLVSGHNDVVMMVLAVSGLLLWHSRTRWEKLAGVLLLGLSVFVKDATIVLVPLLFFPAINIEKQMKVGALLLFGVFLLSPFREEMYPWYAIWWLSLVAFLPYKKNIFIFQAASWVSLGLMLGYIPWIATREYGGITPIARTVLTIVPIAGYLLYVYGMTLKRRAKQRFLA